MDSLLSIRMSRNEIPFHDTFSHFYLTPSSSTERGGGENREIMRWWASCSKGREGTLWGEGEKAKRGNDH